MTTETVSFRATGFISYGACNTAILVACPLVAIAPAAAPRTTEVVAVLLLVSWLLSLIRIRAMGLTFMQGQVEMVTFFRRWRYQAADVSSFDWGRFGQSAVVSMELTSGQRRLVGALTFPSRGPFASKTIERADGTQNTDVLGTLRHELAVLGAPAIPTVGLASAAK